MSYVGNRKPLMNQKNGKRDIEKIFKIGEKFTRSQRIARNIEQTDDRTVYVLCQVDFHEVCLIDPEDGQVWKAPIKVENPRKITLDEFDEISERGHFVRSSAKYIFSNVFQSEYIRNLEKRLLGLLVEKKEWQKTCHHSRF